MIVSSSQPSPTSAQASPSADFISDQERIKELEEQVADLTDERDQLSRENDEREEYKDNGDLERAINNLLDLVERPVGTIKAMLPQTPASERALMALYLAVGRNP